MTSIARDAGADVSVAPGGMRYAAPGRVALLLFCSGLGSLLLQVGWMREFRLVFGGSAAASAAVVAIFMGGLG
ncbi:MAG: hypothetical protein MUF48_15780, partial [Pirellulaceae bacterium]|nr:hypothetical protein [Pirellulaceae bacterium]